MSPKTFFFPDSVCEVKKSIITVQKPYIFTTHIYLVNTRTQHAQYSNSYMMQI